MQQNDNMGQIKSKKEIVHNTLNWRNGQRHNIWCKVYPKAE